MKKETILIACDCNKTLRTLCESFPADDYDIISSNNGIDAVEKIKSKQPRLIILSDNMPEMNGYQVCRLLKNDPVTKSIPVIMITSKDKVLYKYLGFDAVPDENMPKDCDPGELLTIVRQILDGKVNKKLSVPESKPARNIDHVDIIASLNHILDRKVYEATMFSDLTGLVQNIFSYDDLVLAVMDIFSKLVDYSVAMVAILSEDESKLIIHLHEDIEIELFSKIKEFAINKIKEEMVDFDVSKLRINIIRGDRVKADRKIKDIDLDTLLFSQFANNEILKKGFMFLGRPENKIDENKQELMKVIVNESCMILENSWLYNRLYKNMKSLTITDSLTSIYNHKHIVASVIQEFSRARRYKHNISIIMFDIDYFKNVNDTFGHQTGDVVLREIAAIIKDSVRHSDIIGRYGGEEFMILLPETDTEHALLFAERLRKRIEGYNFFNPADPLKITASMGVATYPINRVNDPKAFITCADQALYTAKETGRNRVCVCENRD